MAVLLYGGIGHVHHRARLILAFQRIKQRAQSFTDLAEWVTLVRLEWLAGADCKGLILCHFTETGTIEERLDLFAVTNLSYTTQGSGKQGAEP